MTEEQLIAWGEIVTSAQEAAKNLRFALSKPKGLPPFEQSKLRRRLARVEAILAMDTLYQRLCQMEEAPGDFLPETW